MKIVAHIIKFLLFFPILTFAIIANFFAMFFELFNGLHPKNFFSFPIPEQCDLILELRPDFEFLLRLIIVLINPLFNFYENLKSFNTYEF